MGPHSGFPAVLAVALGTALLGAAGGANAETLRIAGNFAPEHSSSKAMELFKAEVERGTNGALTIDLFPGMQLGGAKENVDAVRSGTIFATWVGAAFVSRLVPEVEAVSLPFLFETRESAFQVIDGPVGKVLEEKLAAKGFAPLGWMELGQRHATNNTRPLKTIDDFKGLKLRMQPNETHLATFRALGANPVAMDVKELYSALQQGVVDGQENPYPIIRASRYFEVQKYLSNTGHFFDFIPVVANRKQFDALKPEYKQAITVASAKAVAEQRKLAAEADAEALKDLQAKGMQYDPLPPETLAALRKATSGVVDEVKKRAGADLVDQVLAAAGKKG